MTKYHKCTGCAVDKETCPRRAKIKTAVAGLHVSLVKFACPERVALFETGWRVSVDLPIYDDTSENSFYCGGGSTITTFPGTVVQETKRFGRYLVRLDLGENEDGYKVPEDLKSQTNGFVNVSAQYMTHADEPSREVCPVCGEIDGKHNGEFFCGLRAAL